MNKRKDVKEIIRQGFEDYANADTKEETCDVKFSKEHEEKMKKMFEDMRKNQTSKNVESREVVIRIKFNWATKVAIAFIVFTLGISALSTGIKAWKEHKLDSYGGNDEYSWLLSNDTSEIYKQKTTDDAVEYVKGILPSLSGDISEVEILDLEKSQRVNFLYKNEKITLKINQGARISIDAKDKESKIIKINNLDVHYVESDDITATAWENKGCNFIMYSNFSENEIKDVIANINYEKIETNF